MEQATGWRLFPLSHSSPALAELTPEPLPELTPRLFAGSETCVPALVRGCGRFLACLVWFCCGVSIPWASGLRGRSLPSLLLLAHEASATPKATAPVHLTMTLILAPQTGAEAWSHSVKRTHTVGLPIGRRRMLTRAAQKSPPPKKWSLPPERPRADLRRPAYHYLAAVSSPTHQRA
jgi:hypothetical protein